MKYKICSKCQYKLPLFANFCRDCGISQTKIQDTNSLNQINSEDESTKAKNKSSLAFENNKISNTEFAHDSKQNNKEEESDKNKISIILAENTELKEQEKKLKKSIDLQNALINELNTKLQRAELYVVEKTAEITNIKNENEKLEYFKSYTSIQKRGLVRNVVIFNSLILLIAGIIYYYFFHNSIRLDSSEKINPPSQITNAPTDTNVNTTNPPLPNNLNDNDTSLFAPSFNCKKASTKVEALICSDRELSLLDVTLASLYNNTKELESNVDDLNNSQTEWLKYNRDMCEDKQCLVRSYGLRIAELSK